jgi:DNA-binding transcriptional ArsR family regulator
MGNRTFIPDSDILEETPGYLKTKDLHHHTKADYLHLKDKKGWILRNQPNLPAEEGEPTEKEWQKFAISHDDLLTKELPPIDFLIQDLISIPGTAVLASPKKRGKSWMALQLSQDIASGAPFLGKATKRGAVIYMALEDGERRLKQRLEKQQTKRGLPITYIWEFKPLNSNAGFDDLTELVKAKQPILVVIDTLAAAKTRYLDENKAGDAADLFNRLHKLATAESCVILIVAHHGKASYGDPGFDIRGSSAISGATDTNLGLYKNSDGTIELKAEGRDIGEVDLRIAFDSEATWRWQCQGDDRDIRRVESEDKILDAISMLGPKVDVATIANEINIARPTVSTHLKRLRNEGKVNYETTKTGRGRKILYSLP